MYRNDDGEELPEWVKNEQEQFSSHRDKDGDGFMDNDEVIYIFCLAIDHTLFLQISNSSFVLGKELDSSRQL